MYCQVGMNKPVGTTWSLLHSVVKLCPAISFHLVGSSWRLSGSWY